MAERGASADKIDLMTKGAPGGGVRVSDPSLSGESLPSANVDPDFRTDNRALAESMAAKRGMFVIAIETLRNGNTIYGLSRVDPASLGRGPGGTRLPGGDPNVLGAEGPKRSVTKAGWMGSEGPKQSMPVTDRDRRKAGLVEEPAKKTTQIADDEVARRQRREAARARIDASVAQWENLGLTNARQIANRLVADGYSANQVATLTRERIMESGEYKSLYGGVQEAQRKAGMPVMSPESIQTQRTSYSDIMRRAGLPKGFYDDPTDFDNFLTSDVSPEEVASRVNLAQQVMGESVTPETMQAFRKYYGIGKGELTAYFLDPDRAEPLLQKQAQAAILGGEATNADLGIGRKYAENLVEKGIDQGQARQAFQESASDLPALGSLAAMEGTDLSQRDVTDANLNLSPKAAQKVKRLASRERARFGGSADASRAFGAQDNTF